MTIEKTRPEQTTLPAYVINDMVVIDSELFERYKQLSPPTVAQYGGRFLARCGQIENLEGDWSLRRVVTIEFPSLERARAWCDSSGYAPAKLLRQMASTSRLIVVEGVAPA